MASILDLKRLQKPRPKVSIFQLPSGKWRGAILFPLANEAVLVTTPTRIGCENQVMYKCRLAGYERTGWDEWGGSPFPKMFAKAQEE